MFGVATFNLDNYKELADITDSIKTEYCQRHGYSFYALRDKTYSPIMGFNKVHFVLKLFKDFPDLEWMLFSECDATITNLSIRIEDKIDNNFHFIVPVDRLNINSGNFLVRNSKEGCEYLQMIIDKEPQYARAPFAEQQVIIDTYQNYKSIVKLVPQKYMNSYEPPLYRPHVDVSRDIHGNSGAWEPGDWIVHWPGLTLPIRLERAKKMIGYLIR